MNGFFIITPLIAVVLLGMAIRHYGFFEEDEKDRLAKLLYWIALPALLFRTVYLSGGDLEQHKNLFLASYASFLVVPATALLLSYLRTKDRSAYALSALCAIRSNNIYLGLPAASLALGEEGFAAALTFCAIGLPGYNLASIAWGEAVMAGGLSLRSIGRTFKRIIKNPLIVACITGLSAAMLNVPIPRGTLEALKLIGDMATGLALISIGMGLEFRDIPRAFRRMWLDIIIKLVLHPAMVWAFFLIWPVPEIMIQACVILAAMPSAVNCFILAKGTGMGEEDARDLIAATTVLTPIVFPIWIWLLGI
ncbi:membrane protein [Synergistales bacterium]|nr:membrane protein [Synergistales bacterium]